VARLKRKPKVSCLSPTSSETTTEVSSGLVLNRLPPGGLEDTTLGAKEGARPGSTGFVWVSPRPEPSSVVDTGSVSGTESPSGVSRVGPRYFRRFLAGLQPLTCLVSPLLRHRIWVFRRLLLLLSSLLWGSFRFLNPFLPLRLSLEQIF
jgi:hypothetical protein